MIPKIIHQIWSGIHEPLPSYFEQLGYTWKKQHPTWKYKFWDNQKINDFINEFYPQYYDAYNAFKYDVQRWDAVRYLILYKQGGVYVDFDYECVAPLDHLLEDKNCCFASEPYEHAYLFNREIYFNNALMASVAGNCFMKEIIDKIFDVSSQKIYSDKMTEVLATTGPLFLTDLYENYAERESIYLIPPELVSPISKMDARVCLTEKKTGDFEQYLKNKLKDAIAIHYFVGAWI